MDRQVLRSHLHFEVLAKLFFDLADERYPAAEKIKQMTAQIIDRMPLDEFENIHMKIAVLSSMRNMIKEVSPHQLFRSMQHRDELFAAIITALEELEDKLEELLEKMALEEEDEEE